MARVKQPPKVWTGNARPKRFPCMTASNVGSRPRPPPSSDGETEQPPTRKATREAKEAVAKAEENPTPLEQAMRDLAAENCARVQREQEAKRAQARERAKRQEALAREEEDDQWAREAALALRAHDVAAEKRADEEAAAAAKLEQEKDKAAPKRAQAQDDDENFDVVCITKEEFYNAAAALKGTSGGATREARTKRGREDDDAQVSTKDGAGVGRTKTAKKARKL